MANSKVKIVFRKEVEFYKIEAIQGAVLVGPVSGYGHYRAGDFVDEKTAIILASVYQVTTRG